MGKIGVLFGICTLLLVCPMIGQKSASGIRYQALLLTETGTPKVQSDVVLIVSLLAGQAKSEVLYVEKQQTRTDAFGYVSLVIGEGTPLHGIFSDIPWWEQEVWVKVEWQIGKNTYRPVLETGFIKSPYAFHARTANQLAASEPALEKNSSIYWTTSGNAGSAEQKHFLGTVDSTDLVLRTAGTDRVILTSTGQVQLISGVDGDPDDPGAYPLVVQGGNQGMYIKINGSRSGDNNFMAFADGSNVWGAVQGQTRDELEADWEYKLKQDLFNLQISSATLSSAGSIAQGIALLIGACKAGKESIVEGLFSAVVDIPALVSDKVVYENNKIAELGVSYETGAGDYAEWLERQPGVRDLFPGEVVGVKGGKISLHTQDADHFMVVSTQPAFLGNMPGKEEDLSQFEKIAFMGQVPVKVLGKASPGDYIIPSGNDDGFAFAVHPDAMQTGDFNRIIGVCWDSSRTDVPLSYLNVAVGIHANTLAKKVEALEREVERIMQKLKGGADPSKALSSLGVQSFSRLTKKLSDAEFDQCMEILAVPFSERGAEFKILAQQRGIDLSQHPFAGELLDNPVAIFKKWRNNPELESIWAIIDEKIIEATNFYNEK